MPIDNRVFEVYNIIIKKTLAGRIFCEPCKKGKNMYTYYYEAKSIGMFGSKPLILDEAYAKSALIGMILFSILAFAMILLSVIFNKKARPLGVVAAIAQPVGLFAAMKCVTSFAQIDFSSLYITVTSTKSLDDAMSKLYEQVGENFVTKVLPNMYTYILWGCLITVATIITLIYAAMLMKGKGKALAVVALILLILRWVLLCPVEMITMFMGNPSQEIQAAWDVLYRVLYILPALFIGISGLMNIKKGAAVEAPVAEATAEAVEAPAEETAEATEAPAEASSDDNAQA